MTLAHYCVAGRAPHPLVRLRGGTAKAGGREIAGRGVPHAAAVVDRDHRSQVVGQPVFEILQHPVSVAPARGAFIWVRAALADHLAGRFARTARARGLTASS
jgi:hypothetical protein